MSEEIESICPTNKQEWRNWLEKNHQTEDAVWLIVYKKSSAKPSLSWSDAVDEALCFGWIDSVRKTIDNEKFKQFYSKRKPASTWSKINKEKVEILEVQGLMTPSGRKCIEIAKKNGSWTILDDAENFIIPEGLEKAFNTNPGSKDFYLSLSKSIQKMMLSWIALAKRPETKQKRITEIAERAAQNKKPKHM